MMRLVTCERDETFAFPMSRAETTRLFRIAAGLESTVPGETQILGQVRAALEAARAAGTIEPELDILVSEAIACARRVRAEIDPRGVMPSVASTAIAKLDAEFGVAGKRALVIGSGVIASLAARELARRGIARLSIVNRTPERAERLAGELGAARIPFENRYGEIAASDIVVSATASPHTVIERGAFALDHRTAFVDLAVPRDIDPALADDANAFMIDIASLATPEADAERARMNAAAAEMIDAAVSRTLAKLSPSARKRVAIGTRGSALAMAQTEFVRARLAAAYPEIEFAIKVVRTQGDRVQDRPIPEIGGDAPFAAEIERALLSGEIDIAVHSMKDLAAELPEGLVLAKAWTREDPRDALVAREAKSLADLPVGAVVATGSVRRTCFLKLKRPDLEIVPIRGNVDTRLRKLFAPADGERKLDAIVLAVAGLKRLGRENVITEYLDPEWMIPAANQGQLAIELRARDAELKAKIDALGNDFADAVAEAERAFLAETGADCHLPVAAYARIEAGRLKLDAAFGDGARLERVSLGGGDAFSSSRYLAEEAALEIRRRLAGKVTLVGAGPGDPELVTMKGLAAIREADAIVYDRLVAPELLKEAKPGCELVYVGKASHSHTMSQSRINALLAAKALRYARVVRLKGGDPFVFGRGAEEVRYLAAKGVRTEVIPGVTSAIAAPESFGIPLTDRGRSSAFHVFTAHDRTDKLADIDFARLLPDRETYVFLMGLSLLEEIVSRFLAAGKSPRTPVSVIASATTRAARAVHGTLADIACKVRAANFAPPAVIVVGAGRRSSRVDL